MNKISILMTGRTVANIKHDSDNNNNNNNNNNNIFLMSITID
jgi:hypothetical protein